MSDEPPTDWFGLEDRETESKKDPGLVVGAPLREHEMQAAHRQHLNSNRAEYAGSTQVLFVDEDGISVEELTKWQRLMEYPRFPNEAEIMGFKAYQSAKLTRAYWIENRDAAALDDADDAAAAQGRVDKQARKPAVVSDTDARLGPVAPLARKNPFNAF